MVGQTPTGSFEMSGRRRLIQRHDHYFPSTFTIRLSFPESCFSTRGPLYPRIPRSTSFPVTPSSMSPRPSEWDVSRTTSRTSVFATGVRTGTKGLSVSLSLLPDPRGPTGPWRSVVPWAPGPGGTSYHAGARHPVVTRYRGTETSTSCRTGPHLVRRVRSASELGPLLRPHVDPGPRWLSLSTRPTFPLSRIPRPPFRPPDDQQVLSEP